MVKKTLEIKEFVEIILNNWERNFGEDVILEVFQHIETNPDLLVRYNELRNFHTKNVTNPFIGIYVKQITDGKTIREVPAKKSKLIGSYTKLEF